MQQSYWSIQQSLIMSNVFFFMFYIYYWLFNALSATDEEHHLFFVCVHSENDNQVNLES